MEFFEHQYDIPSGISDRLELVVRRISFVRKYTMSLLEDLEHDDWYWMPGAYPTHIAWQVGHIAMSHYGLTLFRQRGRNREIDTTLMTNKFRKLFMKGTIPKAGVENNPPPEELLGSLERVFQQTMKELPGFEATLDEPVEAPHAAYDTKFGSLLFVADHEMLHAGQIGMLRRLMGKEPLR